VPYIRSGQTLGLFNPEIDMAIFKPDSGVTREDMVHLITKLISLYE